MSLGRAALVCQRWATTRPVTSLTSTDTRAQNRALDWIWAFVHFMFGPHTVASGTTVLGWNQETQQTSTQPKVAPSAFLFWPTYYMEWWHMSGPRLMTHSLAITVHFNQRTDVCPSQATAHEIWLNWSWLDRELHQWAAPSPRTRDESNFAHLILSYPIRASQWMNPTMLYTTVFKGLGVAQSVLCLPWKVPLC